MNFLGKPKNPWGRVRWDGWALLVLLPGLAAWAAMKGSADLSMWAAAILVPVGLIVISAWLEVKEANRLLELANSLEEKHRLQLRRSDTLERLREQLTALRREYPAPAARMNGAVREALAELDAAGRGEVVLWLHAAGMLSGEAALDLKDADLSGATLGEAQLAGAHLNGANLQQADLRGANLAGASLAGCNLRRARLDDADLSRVDLSGANLRNAHFDRADLTGGKVSAEALDQAMLIETTGVDGVKVTNERGAEYLRKKELEVLVGRL